MRFNKTGSKLLIYLTTNHYLIAALAACHEAHRRTVGQHFRRSLGELGGVVTHGDDGVSVEILGVQEHAFERLAPGLLTCFRVRFNVAADDALEPAQKPLPNCRRTHHDTPDDTEILVNAITDDVVA